MTPNRTNRSWWRPVAATAVAASIVGGTIAVSAAVRDADEPSRVTASSGAFWAQEAAPRSDPPPAGGSALRAADWEGQSYPVDCGGETTGTAATYAEPEPGRDVAVIFVTCKHEAGTPPSAVLVYEADENGDPRLLQTLLKYEDNWTPDDESVTASVTALSFVVSGYSSFDVPRCCPDIRTKLSWNWSRGQYVATGPEPDHHRLPAR